MKIQALIKQLLDKQRSILLLLLVMTLPLGSCARMSYILHAAAGQFSLLNSAVPIENGLESEALTPEQKDRLRLVARIKAFGEQELGLKKTDNYQTVSLKPGRPLYVVSASPRDRLESITWWFPIVGAMPYLGFFERDKAEAQADRLSAKDLDVMIGSADAYSTLGWFQDPVTLNLLEGSTPELVETILHEMTHATLYVKGQGEFNEGLANLVGKWGALLFFRKTVGLAHPFTRKAQSVIEDQRIFSKFLADLLERLEALYTSPVTYEEKLTQREALFRSAKQAFGNLESTLKTHRFKGFGRSSMNNATLMSTGLYHRHFNCFESVLEKRDQSIETMLLFLKGLAKNEGNMIERMAQREG